MSLTGSDPVLIPPGADAATRTEGTNMAFRRDVLARMGGFDPAFAFYMDETDLNMRLARDGAATVIVPLAEVHHAHAESPRRGANRGPRDLFDVGASSMVFLRKHCADARHPAALEALRGAQRRGLIAHMVAGGIEPRDVSRLMRRLDEGIAEGAGREIAPLAPLPPADHPFMPFASRATAGHVVVAGRAVFARRHRARARAAAAAGSTVSMYLFSRTTLAHRVRFLPGGIWEQRGGLWGRSRRTEPLFRLARFSARVSEECSRTAQQRACDG
ncbi:glycosyltransferase family 2 protein [Pseudooceanicola sp. LIPI14-2-Ac024]|uniref:glycosyltransferase family 2 protein n=1 Tax=Pseudooceanicola sp. LIPI14-2-Ac024 TaxID=3344875 RepID=UPI0035D06997